MATPDLADIERALHDHVAYDILLRKEPLARDEDVFDAGFDSMSLSRLLVFVEERFGLRIPDEEVVIDEIATVEKMTHFVAGRLR
jgi:D-alanine--poly(phosphoribitol) ligase subunit 2